MGRVHCAAAALLHVQRHKQLARKERPHLLREPAAGTSCLFQHRQECSETLPREVTHGNFVAVGFELRQKPAGAAVVIRHKASPIGLRTMRSDSSVINK
jgi:hypothetical protein